MLVHDRDAVVACELMSLVGGTCELMLLVGGTCGAVLAMLSRLCQHVLIAVAVSRHVACCGPVNLSAFRDVSLLINALRVGSWRVSSTHCFWRDGMLIMLCVSFGIRGWKLCVAMVDAVYVLLVSGSDRIQWVASIRAAA